MKKEHFYLVTIKGHAKRHYSRQELDSMWANLRKKMKSADWSDLRAYEEDSQGRMHIHCYCRTPRALFYPKYQIPGWSHNFTPFPPEDIDRVYAYLNKHKQYPCFLEQQFIENQARNEYCFV